MRCHRRNSFAFLGFFSVLILLGYGQEDTESLELVQMMYRHGDRAPITLYPNDPYNATIWPNGLGQLTKRGKAMQYALGRWLRNRYKNFISEKWIPEEVYVRSTDVDRTLMSAACNLAALYYPEKPARFEEDVAWLPTPIHTAPLSEDLLLSVDQSCPRIQKELVRQEELPVVKNVTQESQELFQFLTEKSGQNVTTILDVDYLYDTLRIEALYNLTLPDWTHDVLPAMKELSDFSFEIVALSEELKRLRAGPIIGEMGKNMREKVAGNTPQQKMFMYSAHDTTLAQLLLGLGVFNNVAPPYATTFIIELHKHNENEHYVKMFLRNDTKIIDPPYELHLPGCPDPCTLDDWLSITSQVVPEDWAAECKSDDDVVEMATETLIAISAAVFLGILLLLLVIFNICQWKQSKHYNYQVVPNNFT
ncbi:prostatic acid phosphatase-like isoform X1 [Penaeus chinensis]|uniref:prostatic acid phosphatase-like isoform X1 n=1 Tax=Penaeus chinensis TaxID=139456 RepID=UPI001FB7827A|nr:prostatic acid phosphatase-like isoform X1 [Penaeus chinensis]